MKPADKSSAVVIMDRDQYGLEGHRQLFNKNYYVQLDKPIYIETIPMVKQNAQTLYDKKFINAKQKTYLIGSEEPRPRRFYMSPKISLGAWEVEQTPWDSPWKTYCIWLQQ